MHVSRTCTQLVQALFSLPPLPFRINCRCCGGGTTTGSGADGRLWCSVWVPSLEQDEGEQSQSPCIKSQYFKSFQSGENNEIVGRGSCYM